MGAQAFGTPGTRGASCEIEITGIISQCACVRGNKNREASSQKLQPALFLACSLQAKACAAERRIGPAGPPRGRKLRMSWGAREGGPGDDVLTSMPGNCFSRGTGADIVLGGGCGEGVKPKEIAIFGRTEAVLHERAEPALEAAGLKGQLLNDDDPADEDHISLGTMHRAKGLEFKVVAVVGSDLGLLPLRSVLDGFTDPVERSLFVEQERNLLYVTLTRAREQVFISHAGRLGDGRRSNMKS